MKFDTAATEAAFASFQSLSQEYMERCKALTADQNQLDEQQLNGHGQGLSKEYRGWFDPGEQQRTPGSVGGLDGRRALDRHQPDEQHGDPIEPAGRRVEYRSIGIEGEAEQHEHEESEGNDLRERDARTPLDSKILGGHEADVTQHR